MKKEDYNSLYRLFPKQKWLVKKEAELIKLITSCEHNQQKELIFNLLNDFFFVDSELLDVYLERIADYIINHSGYALNKVIIIAMAWEGDPDSSQWIIQLLRPWMTKKGWNNVQFASTVPKGVSLINKLKLDQVILLDEFLGTGKTADIRVNYIRKNTKINIEVRACFIAGMKFGLNCVEESFEDIFCPIELDRGISDKYFGVEKYKAIKNMHLLEKKLLERINSKKLIDYKFGYSKSQALYSSHGNTPNSVFPIFWWPYDELSNNREVLLTRNENELEL